jgi:hypothetical protein
MFEADLDHLLVKMLLAEMNAQAALAGLNLLHSLAPFSPKHRFVMSGGRGDYLSADINIHKNRRSVNLRLIMSW